MWTFAKEPLGWNPDCVYILMCCVVLESVADNDCDWVFMSSWPQSDPRTSEVTSEETPCVPSLGWSRNSGVVLNDIKKCGVTFVNTFCIIRHVSNKEGKCSRTSGGDFSAVGGVFRAQFMSHPCSDVCERVSCLWIGGCSLIKTLWRFSATTAVQPHQGFYLKQLPDISHFFLKLFHVTHGIFSSFVSCYFSQLVDKL